VRDLLPKPREGTTRFLEWLQGVKFISIPFIFGKGLQLQGTPCGGHGSRDDLGLRRGKRYPSGKGEKTVKKYRAQSGGMRKKTRQPIVQVRGHEVMGSVTKMSQGIGSRRGAHGFFGCWPFQMQRNPAEKAVKKYLLQTYLD